MRYLTHWLSTHVWDWTFCCGTFPHVGPKTAVLCGEHGSVRSRHSARPLRAARRPAVQHQPASLPPRRLFLLGAQARVFTQFTKKQTSCFIVNIWSICGADQFKKKGTSRKKVTGAFTFILSPYNKELQYYFCALYRDAVHIYRKLQSWLLL